MIFHALRWQAGLLPWRCILEVIRAADFVLSKAGGHGALRELCDLILENGSGDFNRLNDESRYYPKEKT